MPLRLFLRSLLVFEAEVLLHAFWMTNLIYEDVLYRLVKLFAQQAQYQEGLLLFRYKERLLRQE